MRHYFLLLLLALAFGSISAAACPHAERSIGVPAVIGEFSGGVLLLEVETAPGEGIIYTATTPRVGISTQSSEEAAADYAFSVSDVDRETCDVFYRVSGAGAGRSIEGPSAGAAMAIATIAALQNKNIRKDAVVSGTVEPDGSIGPVGGLIEKGKAAAEKGITVFITPKQELYERIVLASFRQKYGISVVEAGNISAAASIMFAPEGSAVPEGEGLSLEPRKLPENLSLIDVSKDEELLAFREVSAALLRLGENDVERLPEGTADEKKLKEYFRSEIANQKKLIEMGYLFTAANNVFLLGVDVGFLKKGYIENIDLNNEVRDAGSCVSSLREQRKREDDFQWKVGADLRRAWAKKKLNETIEKGAKSAEEKYAAYREILFAESWCRVSSLLGAHEGKGDGVNESAWKGIAEARIKAAEELMMERGEEADSDSRWHLEAAKEEYEEGLYGAAVYDAAYALSMEQADEEFHSGRVANSTLAGLSARNFSSLWGKVYQGQGRFLYSAAGYELKASASAYRILKFADALENATAEMKGSLKAGNGEAGGAAGLAGGVAVGGAPIAGQGEAEALLVCGILAVLGLIIAMSVKIILEMKGRGGRNASGGKGKGGSRKRL